MAPPRKPTAVLALVGALHHDKKRYAARAEEPKPTKKLSVRPPAHLAPEVAACWREIVKNLPPGVGFESDARAMEHFAHDLAYARKVLWRLDPKEGAMMFRHYAAFGMTPADRSRVKVDAPAKAKAKTNEFAKAPPTTRAA